AASQPASATAPLTFEVTFDRSICDHPYSGRVWVMLGRSGSHEPRFGPDWFHPAPFFARDVKDWKPGEPLLFDDQALAFPKPLSEIDPGGMSAQAVMALSPDARLHGAGAGNGYSKAVKVKSSAGAVRLRINKTVPASAPRHSDRVKPFEITSRLLAEFHGRPIKI